MWRARRIVQRCVLGSLQSAASASTSASTSGSASSASKSASKSAASASKPAASRPQPLEGYFDSVDRLWKTLWREVDIFSHEEGAVAAIKRVMARERGVTKRHITDTILRLRLQTRHDQASKVADWLVQDSRFKPEPADLVLRLEMAGRLSVQVAAKHFMELPPEAREAEAYLAMLKTYARWNVVDQAEQMLEEMKSRSYLGSIDPYNVMLSMYRRKAMEERIRATYHDLLASGAVPNTETYLIALRSKKMIGGFDGLEDNARQHLKAMMEKPWRHPLFMLECMIRTYAVLGDVAAIEKLWLLLKGRGRVSSSSYMVMVESYGLLGDVQKAEITFSEMEDMYKRLNFELMVRHFRSLLAAFTDNGAMDKAKEVYNRVIRLKHKISPVIHHDMVSGYIKIKDYDNALRSFEIARDKGYRKLERPMRQTVLLVMKLHADNGAFQAAEKLVYELGGEKPYQGPDIYNLLLHAYRNAGIPVFGFERRMARAGVEPNDETKRLLALLQKPTRKNIFDSL